MSKPIVVRTTEPVGTYPAGAELGFASEDDAASVLGDGTFTVERHQDGSLLIGGAADKPLSAMTRDELNAKARQEGIENPEDMPNKDVVIAAIEGQG